MIKSDSLAKLAPALLKAQKKMGAARKDSKNPFFKSKFADLNSVIDASVDVLNEEGIAVLQTPVTLDSITGGSKSVLRTVLLHESGEMICSDTDIVVVKPNDPQAYGSAVSYARRYGLQSTVTMKAVDDDGETAMGRSASPTPVAKEQTPAQTTSAPVPPKKVTFSKKAVVEDEI